MSVLRFLLTRQALAALTRRAAEPTVQNCRTFVSLASVTSTSNNNKTLFATTITAGGAAASSTQLQTTRGHKRFGHQTEPTPRITKYFHFFVLSLFLISVLDWSK